MPALSVGRVLTVEVICEDEDKGAGSALVTFESDQGAVVLHLDLGSVADLVGALAQALNVNQRRGGVTWYHVANGR